MKKYISLIMNTVISSLLIWFFIFNMKEVQDIFLMLSSYKDGTVPAIILILVLNIISWKKYIEGKNYNFWIVALLTIIISIIIVTILFFTQLCHNGCSW